jgi:nucleoside-diphosphate-sugar epimerase
MKIKNLQLQPVYKKQRKVNAVKRRKANIEQARGKIGFEPEVNLNTGLKELISWMEGLENE